MRTLGYVAGVATLLLGFVWIAIDATLRRWEWAYINAAQQLTHGNISQAARLLGINRTTLYNRIEVLGRAQGDGLAPEED